MNKRWEKTPVKMFFLRFSLFPRFINLIIWWLFIQSFAVFLLQILSPYFTILWLFCSPRASLILIWILLSYVLYRANIAYYINGGVCMKYTIFMYLFIYLFILNVMPLPLTTHQLCKLCYLIERKTKNNTVHYVYYSTVNYENDECCGLSMYS